MGHMKDRLIDVAAFVTRRAAAGLTQEELADRAGLSLSFIKKVEQHSRQMRFRTAWKVAQALGCHPNDFTVPNLDVTEAA